MLFSFLEIIRQIHYNLLLRKKLSRGIVKVAHVGGATPALITQSRTYSAEIEMRSSLFDCRKKKTKTKASSIFAHPHNGGLHLIWRIKILPVK